ncbi:MAG: FumA C-terminus/TtdB family hydratase beta subunit [Deferribacteraceae bacterium]|jgi:fumarate hydratase class I|nr:FumA C-terminus/TtdB family hydratase beta subunit [Deferribacteraceae bacterium]
MSDKLLRLKTPISKDEIVKLRTGDKALLSGRILTARDAAHKLMVEKRPDFLRAYLKDSVIYHCGPIVKKGDDGAWSFISAGPTTSSREEPYEAAVIAEYGVRGIIGKGGMGPKTMQGLMTSGAVYFHAIGGTGALTAKRVVKVEEVLLLEELGSPEAFWVINVEDFPLVVTMDSAGNSLHKEVAESSEKRAQELLAKI